MKIIQNIQKFSKENFNAVFGEAGSLSKKERTLNSCLLQTKRQQLQIKWIARSSFNSGCISITSSILHFIASAHYEPCSQMTQIKSNSVQILELSQRESQIITVHWKLIIFLWSHTDICIGHVRIQSKQCLFFLKKKYGVSNNIIVKWCPFCYYLHISINIIMELQIIKTCSDK